MKKCICVFVCCLLTLSLTLTACLKKPDSKVRTDAELAVEQVAESLGFASEDAYDNAALCPEGEVTLTESGTYLFRGDYGKLTLGAGDMSLHLVLDGAHFTCADGVAVDGTGYKNNIVTVTLADGSENSISNGKDNALHLKGSLDINGDGTLSVTGKKNGIKVSGALRVADATLSIDAGNHAIAAQSIAAKDATIGVLSAGKDGLNAECDDDTTAFVTTEGFVALRNVRYSCTCDGDGIQADTVVYIDGGSYSIHTAGEFVADTAANRAEYDLDADDFRYVKRGSEYYKVASDYMGGSLYALAQGCKGIKVGEIEYPDPQDPEDEITVTQGDYCIFIADGDIEVDSVDDAVHANSGSILIDGGTLTLSTYDDGITADLLVDIRGGDIEVVRSYEGIEGSFVQISGGRIRISATDDGINAASDNEQTEEYILIEGGEVTVNADGDGIDSNGWVEFNGGTVVVHGPTSNGDGGLDSETGIYANGGTLFVAASRGMTELPLDKSDQYVIAYGANSTLSAGTVISVRDGTDTLFETTLVKAAQTVIFSSGALTKGKTYSLYADDGKLADITVSDRVTSSGVSGGFGGAPDSPGGGMPGGPGGRPPR